MHFISVEGGGSIPRCDRDGTWGCLLLNSFETHLFDKSLDSLSYLRAKAGTSLTDKRFYSSALQSKSSCRYCTRSPQVSSRVARCWAKSNRSSIWVA